jgi:hypothetical protein
VKPSSHGISGKVNRYGDLTAQAGQVHLVEINKTVLIVVPGLDSEARRDGEDFAYMTCNEACARSLKMAFENEVEQAKR